jgi:cell wall-associated NlpC family hydrolase
MHMTRTLVATVVAGALVLAAGVTSSVSAAPSADIQQVQAQVQDLQMKAEAATERANEAQARVDQITSDLVSVKNKAAREREQLGGLMATINDIARNAYASGGMDPTLQVLLAEDPAEFLAQAAVMGQLEKSQIDQLRQTQTARLRLAQTEAEITDKEQAAQQASDDKQAAQADAARELQAAQDVLGTLQADERKRLEELAAKKREQEMAAAAAAAADAKKQAAASAAAASSSNVGSNGAGSSNDSSNTDTTGSSGGNDASAGGTVDSGGSQDANAAAAAGGGFVGGTKANLAVQYALAQVGDSYVAAAAGPGSFDCSGLTMAAYRQAGVALPHLSYSQFDQTRHVPVSEIQPGDLVFYFGSGAHHVGIYVGNGKMVSASNPSDGVELIDFLGPWYGDRFSGVGRVVG